MKISAKQYASALLESLVSSPGGEKAIIKSFASFLTKRGQSSRLPEILEHFEAFWDKYHGISNVEIVSARPLSEEVYSLLADKAALMSGVEKVETVRLVKPEILGGVILRYRDKVLDMSLYTKFEHLKSLLKG
jgi:F-type H+-transporting ATPase subunit delta